MKRTILSFVLLASISLTAFATTSISQQKRDRKDFPKELKLSDEQKKQMKEINKDFAEKIGSVKKSRIVAEVQQERIKALRDEKREAIGKILTPEQKEQFDKRRSNQSERGDRKQPRSNHKGNIRHKEGFKMYENLNLTDAQKQQMKSLREKFATEHKDTVKKHREEMKKIFTPEQLKKLDENKAKFAENRKNNKINKQQQNKAK